MIFLLLDILIYNYTIYNSYFFLVYLYNKTYLYYLSIGLLLDLIVLNTYFINTIIISIIYLINLFFKRYNIYNKYIYLLVLLIDYIVFISLSNLYVLSNYKIILYNIGINLIINIIFYYLCYKSILREYN